MSFTRKLGVSLWRFLASHYEDDVEFRNIILELAKRGLMALSVLGITCTAALLLAYVADGRTLGVHYGEANTVVLWDKLFIVFVCSIGIATTRTRFGPRWCRRISAVMIFAVIISVVIDDVAGGNITFSSAYVSLIMLAATGMMPYRPMQVFVSGIVVSVGFLIMAANLPQQWEVAGTADKIPRFVFLLIVTFICTGLSSLLYNHRYERHKAQSRSELFARRLERANEELKLAFEQLTRTQDRLIHSEKMASLGRLSAGIAHEIKNPLNLVNNFALLNGELATELSALLAKHADAKVSELEPEIAELLVDLVGNAERINQNGRRADDIVEGMMQHANGKVAWRHYTPINGLVDDYVNLSYSGFRSRKPDFEISLRRTYDDSVGDVEVGPHELGKALASLLNNAFDAVVEKANRDSAEFDPLIDVRTVRTGSRIEIIITDNGIGIPEDIKHNIFEPFFTTKPTGTNTGLGLSLAYDIVTQGHGGAIHFDSTEGEGSTFTVTLFA